MVNTPSFYDLDKSITYILTKFNYAHPSSTLPQLDERWAKQNFPVECVRQDIVKKRRFIKVLEYNMSGYRILRHGQNIVGYSRWDEPSEHHPHGLIRDPIVPDEDPMDVIASVQARILAPRAWQTAEGGKYEETLVSCGCVFKPTTWIIMHLSFGEEFDLTGYYKTAWL